MESRAFAGERKRSVSLLSRWERPVMASVLRRVPRSVGSHHLTLLTLLWSVLVFAASALATRDRLWLNAVSALIALQYTTDAIDGKLGAVRGQGLVRWGFYMDHLLDYVFLCSILLGYARLVPPSFQWMMTAVLAVAGAFMVSSFLACCVDGELGISFLRLGPIEIRIVFIAINTWFTIVGKAPLGAVLPAVIAVSATACCGLAYQTQRRLWDADQLANPQSAITTRPSPMAGRQSILPTR
jgi:phosphatidylglycerophosphate synthase